MIEKCLSCRNFDFCNHIEVLCEHVDFLEDSYIWYVEDEVED